VGGNVGNKGDNKGDNGDDNSDVHTDCRSMVDVEFEFVLQVPDSYTSFSPS
jgi:hypothetical protein